MEKAKRMKYIYSLIFAVLLGLLSILFTAVDVLETVDAKTTDLLYQRKGSVDRDIVVLGIDDKTLATYGSFEATKYRKLFTEFLNGVADSGVYPKVIGFDILFGTTDTATDTAFAESIARCGNVVLATTLNPGEDVAGTVYGIPKAMVDSARAVGFVDAKVDKDNCIRKFYPKGNTYDSLAYTMYGIGEGKSYDFRKGYYLFDYSTKKDEKSLSFCDFLNGTIKYTTLKNKTIFIGAHASGLASGGNNDLYSCPIPGEDTIFGVEVQANIYQALKEDRIYSTTPKALEVILNFTFVVILSFLFLLLRFRYAAIAAAGGAVLEVGISLLVHVFHSNYAIANPLILTVFAFILVIAYHYYYENKKKKEVLGTFKRYISPDVADSLVNQNREAMSLGGVKRQVAVLFVDIRGFTKMSEELPPEVIVDILNGYLGVATEQIFKYGGMLDKFIGDAVMAIFNAPVDQEDYTFKAVCAAYGILTEGKKIADGVFEKYNKSLAFGIGVHTGDAIIGNIGCDIRMDFTAIGDTVNTASRLESNAAGNQILVSDIVYEKIKDRVTAECVGGRTFKNKKEPILCYDIKEVHPDALRCAEKPKEKGDRTL